MKPLKNWTCLAVPWKLTKIRATPGGNLVGMECFRNSWKQWHTKGPQTQWDPAHEGTPPKGPRCARQFPTVQGVPQCARGFPTFVRVFPTVHDFSHDVPSSGVPLGRVPLCAGSHRVWGPFVCHWNKNYNLMLNINNRRWAWIRIKISLCRHMLVKWMCK